jgi:glutathione S-transferase
MQLIGMLDSPFVRRAFISGRMLDVPFEHRALSVFHDFAEFHAINPVVRAPTLVLDDGEVLVDSDLIVEAFEEAARRRLLPADAAARERCRVLIGYALALCDKAVQLYYELSLRPQHLRWDEWITRCASQLRDTCAVLEAAAAAGKTPWLCGDELSQADISVAVAWRFTHHVLPHILDKAHYPVLAEHSDSAEAQPAFQAADFD